MTGFNLLTSQDDTAVLKRSIVSADRGSIQRKGLGEIDRN